MKRLPLLALLALASVGCRAAGHLPVAREFVPTRDAFGDTVELAAVIAESGDAPWSILVGGADQLDALFDARRSYPVAVTVVDLSLVDSLQRDAAAARALEAALESDGAVLLDERGTNARSLRGTSRAVSLVALNGDQSVASIIPLAGGGGQP